MRVRKTSVQRRLKPAYLQAIGLVAAQWSALELAFLSLLSKLAGTDFINTIILAGPANLAAWADMFRKLAKRSPDHAWKEPQLKAICKTLTDLQTERNGVVHACWDAEDIGIGLAPPKITGWGIPKRGLKTVISIEKTPAEMRDLARRIEAAERGLFAWWNLKPPKNALPSGGLASLLPQNLQPTTATHQTQQATSRASAKPPPAPQKP